MEISSEHNQTSDLLGGKTLSAKELFKWRRRDNAAVPHRGGVKDFEPDDSWLQAKRLEAFFEEELSVLGEPRVEKSGNLVQGVWDEKLGLVNIEKTAKFWMKMGFAEHNRNWLHPEEALFLMEVNCLEVQNRGLSLSLQEAYDLFLGLNSALSLEEYQVYAHLRRLGYIVIRHCGRLKSTPYERTIKLDKHRAKKKRKHDRAKEETGEDVLMCQTAKAATRLPSGLENNACFKSTVSAVGGTQSKEEQLNNNTQEEDDGICKGVETGLDHDIYVRKCCVNETEKQNKANLHSTPSEKQNKASLHSTPSEKHLNGADGQSADSGEPATKRQRLEEFIQHLENLDKADNIADLWTAATLKSQAMCLEFHPDTCRFSSWDFKEIRFPCIAGKSRVVQDVPARHLLPQNVDISEDFDDICLFDVEDYKRQQLTHSGCSAEQADSKYSHLEQLQFSYTLWLQKHCTPVQARNWGEWKREMTKRMDSFYLNSPVSHLWQGEVTPLLQPEDASTTDKVLSRLNIIRQFQGDFEAKERDSVKISFDVYLPNTTFKKTNPGAPNHRICVTRDLQPPGLSQLQATTVHLADRVPLHWAVVASGEICFFVLENTALPVNPSPLG